jgi:hypothetical protein
LISLGKVEEFFLLTEYIDGQGYNLDLERLRDTGTLTDLDAARADALCDYLAEIHRAPVSDADLYVWRIRELVGHCECIMASPISYPPHPLTTPGFLEEIERRCIGWRWRLKGLNHRLRQVHGTLIPGIFSSKPARISGCWTVLKGNTANPPTMCPVCPRINLFFSLQRTGRLEGALEKLFLRFWEHYLEKNGDREMLRVAAPLYAFRGLVMASPLWYPTLADTILQVCRARDPRLVKAAPTLSPVYRHPMSHLSVRTCGSKVTSNGTCGPACSRVATKTGLHRVMSHDGRHSTCQSAWPVELKRGAEGSVLEKRALAIASFLSPSNENAKGSSRCRRPNLRMRVTVLDEILSNTLTLSSSVARLDL